MLGVPGNNRVRAQPWLQCYPKLAVPYLDWVTVRQYRSNSSMALVGGREEKGPPGLGIYCKYRACKVWYDN